ncbi:DUF2141 domain-containing protein [Temperatibacter marinus]|uniref:DUF2141 domain-containing protein n=1 Tax=Temperatibacter marinus TaxID=1456591 RepID=A0AA52EDV0_9PROT|nr:DUF2141 domain-containing protein [Temperatibacter marinus]WND01858.1 DUF2141 domain-containing protein [Temperatibacter marinus]
MKATGNIFLSLSITAGLLLFGAWSASLAHQDTEATEDKKSSPQSSPHIKPPSVDDAELPAEGVTVTIKGIENSTGKIIVMIFNEKNSYAAYDFNKAVGYREIAPQKGKIMLAFPELKQGPYAVVLFHDENENYDLDMRGDYPLEGYGTSGARDAYDQPSFKKAAQKGPKIVVTVYYLK